MITSDGDGKEHVASHLELVDKTFDATGTTAVDVVALDECLEGERVTFIKLEIEGAELEALRGARAIITDNRPKLAISAYHRGRDLINLFEMVSSLDAGYRIDLAHHRESVSGSVYYCVPPR